MKTIIKEFELQIDNKPNGSVIRLNDKEGCILIISQIPKKIILMEQFIDVTFNSKILEHPEFIQKIDWKLLRKQKNSLTILTKIFGDKSNVVQDINGILFLIDSIQDYGADEMGISEKEVFNLNPEENEL